MIAETERDGERNCWRIDRDSQEGSFSEHDSDFEEYYQYKAKENNFSLRKPRREEFGKTVDMQRGLPCPSVQKVEDAVQEIDWAEQDSNVIKKLLESGIIKPVN